RGAGLTHANLTHADLTDANLRGANLTNAVGLIKLVGAIPGNCYWKRFDTDLTNNGFAFRVGPNTLRPNETFAADERVLCSYPGFHFASRSWCAVNYSKRPYEALIRVPADAQVNEPWATDGKASADKIEILQVFCTKTGADVTGQFIR
ncbi:MAG: pentapeptide repeat-containing protein, partial [Lentisphaeria bacterium]|nr:pentapeptide repeat-containing protein [Lentisphaeria bacterium]